MYVHVDYTAIFDSDARKKKGIVIDKARAFAAKAPDFVQKWRLVLVLVQIISVTPEFSR